MGFLRMEGLTYHNPYELKWTDRLVGYKMQTYKDFFKDYADYCYVNSLKEFYPDEYKEQKAAGSFVPRVIVDKPYIENAAHMQHVMGEYIVERGKGKQFDMFWVTLI